MGVKSSFGISLRINFDFIPYSQGTWEYWKLIFQKLLQVNPCYFEDIRTTADIGDADFKVTGDLPLGFLPLQKFLDDQISTSDLLPFCRGQEEAKIGLQILHGLNLQTAL